MLGLFNQRRNTILEAFLQLGKFVQACTQAVENSPGEKPDKPQLVMSVYVMLARIEAHLCTITESPWIVDNMAADLYDIRLTLYEFGHWLKLDQRSQKLQLIPRFTDYLAFLHQLPKSSREAAAHPY